MYTIGASYSVLNRFPWTQKHRNVLVSARKESMVNADEKFKVDSAFHKVAVATTAWVLASSMSIAPSFADTSYGPTPTNNSLSTSTTDTAVEPVYFGNGCFWGRQKDFVDAEVSMGRTGKDISAIVGYAGGKIQSPKNKVCYYYTPEKETVYERLGHAEVVQVELKGDNESEKAEEYRKLAEVYFNQFRKLPNGKMLRQDPQDQGPGYRNVIGIPGGVDSPYFSELQKANVHGMNLVEGKGNEWTSDGRPTEGDELNTVWVVDSNKLPFYRAEVYHQYHNGLGKKFPEEYTKEMKGNAEKYGRIAPTGCPELFFMAS